MNPSPTNNPPASLTNFSIHPKVIRVVLLLVAILSGAGFVLMFALRLKLVTTVNSDIGGVEQNVIYAIQQMLGGKPLYTDPGTFPFYINQYTPFYSFTCYITALLLHAGPGDLHQLYLIGRTWNLIFNLVSMGTLALIAARFFNLPKTVAFTIACCSFIFIYRQGFCARADSMLDATLLVSIYFFLKYLTSKSQKSGQLILPLLLAVSTIFIKQSGIQLPIIFLGFLLFNAPFKTFLRALLITGIAFGVILAILIGYYKEPFLQNVIGGVANGVSYLWVKNFLWGNGLKTKVVLPAIICCYIVLARLLIFRGSLTERLLCYCVSGMFLFNAVISFKAGSNIQYFLVFTDLSLLLIVYYFFGRYYQCGHKQLKGWYQHLAGSLSLGFLLLLMLANLNHQYEWIKSVEYDQKPLITQKEQTAASVAAFIQSVNTSGNYVFANLSNEREDLSYCGRRCINNILYKTCAIPGLDILDISTVKSKVFGYANFEQLLKTGKIRYIIEGRPANKSGIPFINTLRERLFTPVKQIDGYTIYQYRESLKAGTNL